MSFVNWERFCGAMSVVLIALVAVVTYLLGRLVLAKLRMYRITRNIPGPPVYPVIGSFLSVAGPLDELFEKSLALGEQYGSIFKMWLGPELVVVVSDPDDLQMVLMNSHMQNKAEAMYKKAVEPISGQGLLTINDPVLYKQHRNAIVPGFHAEIMPTFVATFQSCGKRLAEVFSRHATDGRPVNAEPLSGLCTAEAMCQSILRKPDQPDKPDPSRESYAMASIRASKLLFYRAMRPWFHNDTLFKLSPMQSEHCKAESIIRQYVTGMLDHKMQKGMVGPKETYLDHLLASEKGAALSRREVLGELQSMMWAAITTTTDGLTFLIYSMALRPDLQEKVHEELDEIFDGDVDRDVTPADLARMHYLERVIKEVLRYFTPSPVFAREPDCDITLPSGYVLPRGCVVLMATLLTHKDPRFFPEPHAFDPDRFLPEVERARHSFAYLPFSAGPRSCTSKRFAMMYLKAVGAMLFSRLRFSGAPHGPKHLQDIRKVIDTGMHTRDGAWVVVEHRRPNCSDPLKM